MMTELVRDALRGWRVFASQPAFAWAAAVTLGLAIGANTLIFTMANVLVVKPLPFANDERLGWILVSMPGRTADRAGTSLPEFATFRDELSTLTRLAAWQRQPVTLRERGDAERVMAQVVIGDLQGLWGLRALRGRTLTAGDEVRGAAPVVVLSHQFWATRFGGADGAVGRDLLINGQPYTVVGVLAPEIEIGNLSEIDVWLPYTGDPSLASRTERGWRPVGRLDGDATLADAHAQVAAIAERLEREHPETNRDWIVRVGSTRTAMLGTNSWVVLSLLTLVVSLLLLLACANVMNLLFARLIGRRQELAVRTALGATRGRVVRQVVAESLTLGCAGGLLGLAVAWGGLQGIHAVAAEPFFRQLAIDVRVVLFAVLLSFVAPLVFAVVPALRILRDDVRSTLSEGSLRSVGSQTSARGRSTLVVLQVGVAVMLLIASALVVQSMQAIISADPGYDISKLLVTQVDVPAWKIRDETGARQMRDRLLERVTAMPSVESAALATHVLALHPVPQVAFDIDARTGAADRDRPAAGLVAVTAAYFETVRVPLLEGRGFVQADAAGPPVAIVSAEVARRHWPSPGTALGSSLRISDGRASPLEAVVVGVAADTADAIQFDSAAPTIFVLDAHVPLGPMHVLVRGQNPAALAMPFRRAISEVDPDLAAFQLRTLREAFADEGSSNQLLSGLLTGFALVAILLAMAGLYGVMSYAVSQRTGEIAVRMALGAPGRAIARDVIGESLKLAATGVVLGAAGAYALARAVASILFGVTASDPPTYVAAITLTFAAAFVATWVPMRRAATIDPIESLRRA